MVKALINLGREGSVNFHENPVLHCMSISSPVVVVVLLALTAFPHFQWLQLFPIESCPVFAPLFTKIKAHPIIEDYLKGHVTSTSMWICIEKVD